MKFHPQPAATRYPASRLEMVKHLSSARRGLEFAIGLGVAFTLIASPCHGAERSHLTLTEAFRITVLHPLPRYPPGGIAAGMQGAGVFRIDIRKTTGEVIDVKVVKSTGYPELDLATTTTFRRWRFRPGLRYDGFIIPVIFTLSRSRGYRITHAL